MSVKLTREVVTGTATNSFVLTAYSNPYFEAPFHFHPEYELILIEEGEGTSYVGNSTRKLQPGDYMLIGSNLAHMWLSDEKYYNPETTEMSGSVYAQFGADVIPGNLESLPELSSVYQLLKISTRGLIFSGPKMEKLAQDFREIVPLEGFAKWSALLTLLYNLSREADFEFLTNSAYNTSVNTWTDKVVERINQFVALNYCRELSLAEMSEIVHMNPSSLCRYYKRITGETIFDYVAQTRIDYSLKLLRSTSYSVSRIALECGYNSPSHFYSQFKKVTGSSPSEYVESLRKINKAHNPNTKA